MAAAASLRARANAAMKSATVSGSSSAQARTITCLAPSSTTYRRLTSKMA